jgi:hypothetical protein
MWNPSILSRTSRTNLHQSGVIGARFNAVAYGVDDLTLGFDMEGSRSVAALNAAPGSQTRRGKMLGEPASWGKTAMGDACRHRS